jgi:hypothetical protein
MSAPQSRVTKDKSAKPKKKKATTKESAKAIQLLQRQTWATDLRVQGMTYRRIARRMKELRLVSQTYSASMAFEDVKAAMAETEANKKELAIQNFHIDELRYDELFEKSYALALPRAEEGELELPPDPVHFGAVMHILSVRERLYNYKAIYGDKEKEPPNFDIHLDLSVYSIEELLTIQHKIQQGEDAILVITEIQEARKRKDQTAP